MAKKLFVATQTLKDFIGEEEFKMEKENKKYTLQTKIKFGVALGRHSEESIQTMEELGFTQEDLDKQTQEEIETELQGLYLDWEANYLDSGWAAFEE